MKTKLLFIALFLGASLLTFAQSLVIMHDGVELEPNEVIQVAGEATAPELVVEFDVKNTTSGDIEANVQRYEMPLYEGHTGTFCWAGLCYPPFIGLSPNTVVIPGGVVHEDDFSGHVNPYGVIGTTVIAYTFFDVNNTNDSVQVVVQYLAGTVGVNQMTAENTEVSIYPNPVSDVLNINIDAEFNEAVTCELLSITGSTVKKNVSQQSNVKFDVTDLSEGLYLYRVSSEKNIIKTGRVVIKH